MNEVAIKITSCQQCPHFSKGGRQTTDGFDSGYDWFCGFKKGEKKLIVPFVEWNEVDKMVIPDWCPAKL